MKKILVVVDMQNDFIDGSLGTKEAVAIVDNVVNKIRNTEAQIIVTRDTHFEDYLQTAEGKKLPVEHCIKDTHGWKINSAVKDALRDKDYVDYINKLTFGSTELPKAVSSLAQGEDFYVELVGLCTDICVVSNALLLKAHFPSTKISVDSSCCAGVTPETHEAALTTMRMCQIDII